MERQPKNCEEAGQFAENYLQARATPVLSKSPKTPSAKCPKCGRHGHWARDCPRPRPTDARDNGPRTSHEMRHQKTSQPYQGPRDSRPPLTDTRGVRCFNCSKKGHYASNCPKRSLYCGPRDATAQNIRQKAERGGTVNGIYCPDIVIDTGATQTLVHRKLVTDEDILDDTVDIKCAHGDTTSYPLAAVKITIIIIIIITTAAASSTLPTSALLGWDVPELMDYIPGTPSRKEPAVGSAFATTRSQTATRGLSPTDEDQPDTEDPTGTRQQDWQQDADVDGTFACLDDSLFTPTVTQKPVLTRSQKRADRRRYRIRSNIADPPAEDLRALQESDSTLDHARSVADGAPTPASGERFFRRDGVLYRRYSPPGGEEVEQLVLPMPCRPTVLRLAHNIPLAGHLGRKKTTDRIKQRFYWPGMFRDTEDHCQTCPECLKYSTRRPAKAPLLPLPIMEEPFQRIAMDIVGPLPRSSSGFRYILVIICDYATRYPEAIALRTIDAGTVA